MRLSIPGWLSVVAGLHTCRKDGMLSRIVHRIAGCLEGQTTIQQVNAGHNPIADSLWLARLRSCTVVAICNMANELLTRSMTIGSPEKLKQRFHFERKSKLTPCLRSVYAC